MSGNSSPSHSTDTSLSLSPGLLPEKNAVNEQRTSEHQSSISEHISSINSLENDRSLVEIEISNIPDLNTILGDNDVDLINASPPLSLNLSNLSNSAAKNVKSVLEEILHNEQFKSERSDRLDSNDDVSLNIFDGVHLDDSSINDYVRKLRHPDHDRDVFGYDRDDAKVRSLEDALSVKDGIIQALNVEVESLKDLASNPSTLSMNTTLTEYKMFQEECATKFVNFESALAHRDGVIARLKDALIAAQKQEDDMRAECEQYGKDIQCVQKELAEAVEYIKKCKCLDKTRRDVVSADASSWSVSDSSDDAEMNAIYEELARRLGAEAAENDEFVRGFKSRVNRCMENRLGEKESAHLAEVGRLKEKHVKEMDDTRKFYEEKCADLDGTKVISNELISPSSRKLSEDDLQSDDDISGLFNAESTGKSDKITAEDVYAFKDKIDAASRVLNKYDMEDLGEDALRALKTTMDGFKFIPVRTDLLGAHYQAQIESLREELKVMQQVKELKDVEVQVNSTEQEIDGIVQNYQVSLAEQVELAKADIMKALEDNISKLAESPCDDSDWPKEFHEIRNKLTQKHERNLQSLKESHKQEVQDLKKQICSQERQTTNANLRKLLIDINNYIEQCEEELNTTLFEELAKSSYDDTDCDSTSSSSTCPGKRVHLTPNIKKFIAEIERNGASNSLEFTHEFGHCLDRLRNEANAILELTSRDALGERRASHAKTADDVVEVAETQGLTDDDRDELVGRLREMHAENAQLQNELQSFKHQYLEFVQHGWRETVTSGYSQMEGAERMPLFDLMEAARRVIAEKKGDNVTLIYMNELVNECDQLVDTMRKERLDHAQQIDAADKKLKSTQTFLDQQAAEREQERDDAAKMIKALQDQLHERQKDRAGYERASEATLGGGDAGARDTGGQFVQIVKTVEGFERQMHEMSKLIADGEKRFQEVNTDREEAIEKIGLLRDIINDLEKQLEAKEENEEQLKFLLEKQREANDDLVKQLETASNTTNFQEYIVQLEEEVGRLRRASDIVGNEGLIKQIQLQLHELELSVDKNTREFESLYAARSSTTCSTPSEEMSVQDQIRPKTPNSSVDDCEVPLQQLARLKEKLLKHSRAENSAIKRIQDMELQLLHAKQENEELHSEKIVLKEQISEQLVLISSLQMRLDDQRIRAEHVQKQANVSLEMKIYDLENDLQSLRDKLQSRDSTIKQLNKIIDETKQRLKDREDELSSTLEESEVCDLKAEIERLKSDNDLLRQKIESDAQNAQILPSLVDNIIADKNRDIETLRMKLQESERQFEWLRSISSVERSEDMTRGGLSYLNVSSPEKMRCAPSSPHSLNATKFVPEISCIEKVGPPNVNYTTDASLMKPNSTEIHKTIERHVHFEDELDGKASSSTLAIEIHTLREELQQAKTKLAEAETNASELKVEVVEKKMHLTEREKEILALQEDAKRKDDMYMQLAKEKREMNKQFSTLDDIKKNIESLQANEQQLKDLLQETQRKYEEKERIAQGLHVEFANYKEMKEREWLDFAKEKMSAYEELSQDFEKLHAEYEAMQAKYGKESIELKHLLEDRDCELQILREDVTRYQKEIYDYEDREKQRKDKMEDAVLKKDLAQKKLEIVKLTSTIDGLRREMGNVVDQLYAKDQIIATMKEDSETLRINLETIKAKMNETGNIFDLRQKLNRERELNAHLHAENSIDDVVDQVRQQLNDSAQLDDKILNALSSGDFNTQEIELDNLPSSIRGDSIREKIVLEERISYLEEKLKESNDVIAQVKESMADQQKLFNHRQVEDTNIMTQIRTRLEEAMESAIEYENQLAQEKALRNTMEEELTILRRHSNTVSTNSTTEYVSLENMREQRLQREVKQLREEIANLKREIKNLKKARNATECELKYSKEMLELKTTEVFNLEKIIAEKESDMRKVEDDLKAQKREIDMKTWEVEHNKSLVSSLEHEKLQLNMQISMLELKQPVQEQSPVSEVFLQKMKDLGELVTEHINENKLMSATIAKLISERNELEQKVHVLEDRDRAHAPFDDPVARANHLFGKYLRADSYRHALTFQKKYLIGLLATYQDAIGPPLSKFEPKKSHARGKAVNRFRAVAVVFVAIFRMKYMVQRWHSGSRSGAYMSLQRKFRGDRHVGTHFQVGKPVSSEHFRIAGRPALRQPPASPSQVNATPSTSRILPWSGVSPPCKERANGKTVTTERDSSRKPSGDLNSCFERFHLIQQRLGTTLNRFDS